jgi:hypothetical protein
MQQKVRRLKELGHDLVDDLVAIAMIISLPNSYATLRQLLHIIMDPKLTSDYSIQQVIIEEKTQTLIPSHIILYVRAYMQHNNRQLSRSRVESSIITSSSGSSLDRETSSKLEGTLEFLRHGGGGSSRERQKGLLTIYIIILPSE